MTSELFQSANEDYNVKLTSYTLTFTKSIEMFTFTYFTRYLSIYLSIYLILFLSIYLSIYLSHSHSHTHTEKMCTNLFIYLLTYIDWIIIYINQGTFRVVTLSWATRPLRVRRSIHLAFCHNWAKLSKYIFTSFYNRPLGRWGKVVLIFQRESVYMSLGLSTLKINIRYPIF